MIMFGMYDLISKNQLHTQLHLPIGRTQGTRSIQRTIT